ncbi:hypothetical protein E4U43_003978 [Claviceps pusilla]|uniref:EngB-type G domain-containing protein n=1 Tax=Claviceps pusilla TaxID=123648 RepID=A0A9P7N6F6_9HYPO|nr:hypothetical protein E4U43_003978 [Claviceps pusilla]
MLPLRRTLRAQFPTHIKASSSPSPSPSSSSSPFSVSTHQCIRQRPTRRPAALRRSTKADGPSGSPGVAAPEVRKPSCETDLRHGIAESPCSSASPAHHHPQAPLPPDTSVSGPFKQVLLSSRIIAHHLPPSSPVVASSSSSSSTSISSSSSSDNIKSSFLTTRTTPLQTRQLSAAEGFFAHNPHKFLYSAESLRHHVPNTHVPEIIILGASNVGKSTFLNALVGSAAAARVSQRPGRTTLMNAFGIGPLPKTPLESLPKGQPPPRHSLVLVDTPGYGYKSRASWGDAVVQYLQTRTMLRGAVVLLSSEKKRLLPEDKWMLRTLAEANTRTVVVLTKADKSRAGWADQCVLMADAVESELTALHYEFGGRWRDCGAAAAATARIYITSAGMDTPGKLRNGAGIGGVRMAILEMAGFTLQDTVTKKADAVTYSGPIVSFDDIVWKTA